MRINDIDLEKWDNPRYDHLNTGTWWDLDHFDGRPESTKDYHGLFIPQIPRQLIERYTRKGDVVLDPFCGAGTTAIECMYLERRSANTDLNGDVLQVAVKQATRAYAKQNPPDDLTNYLRFRYDDARDVNYTDLLDGWPKATLAILHPPYFNIVQFTDSEKDLCNEPSLQDFLIAFSDSVAALYPHLVDKAYLGLVIGDYYADRQWVPLGFYCMEQVLANGFKLKAINVKKTVETRGKGGQRSLWRYRCLKNGTQVFAHEYVMVFRKTSKKGDSDGNNTTRSKAARAARRDRVRALID